MLKRLFFIFLLISGGIAAVAFFFWQQATQLPSWYSESSTPNNQLVSNKTKEIQQAKELVWHKVTNQLREPTKKQEVKLDEQEINTLFLAEITDKTDGSKLASAVKATNTKIQDDKIEMGAIIDFSNLPNEQLQAGERATIAKIIKQVPSIAERPVYIGFEGKPQVNKRQISLDKTTRIKVGNISLTPKEISQRLGIPEETLLKHIESELNFLPMEVDSAQILGGKLVVKGSGTAW